MNEYVVGLFPDPEDARRAIEDLRAAGVSGADVGVVMPSREERQAAHDGTGPTARDVGVGAAVGGLLGGLGGWLVGLAALSIPGIGPIVTAGVFGAAMAGTGLGIGAGAVAGALRELGLPHDEAEGLEREVSAGNTLVSVRALDAEAVREILARHGSHQPMATVPVVPPGPA